jgi:hypothetical protein
MRLFFWEKRSQNVCVHCKYDFVLHDMALILQCEKSQRLVVPASVSKTRKYMTFKFSPYRPEFIFFTYGVCDGEINLVNFLSVFTFILLLNVMYFPAPKMILLLTLNFDFCVHGL